MMMTAALGLALPLAAEELSDSSRVIDLDELIVVAQPKENFRLRQQPLSSTVMTSEEMKLTGMESLAGATSYVPSFVMPDYGSRLTSSIYVRGIGSRINNPAVGVYLDNIPLLGKSAYNTHLYQIDRVDILRGAQGTLYGMNTEGGLVRLFTKNPMNYQGTDLHLSYGTYNRRNIDITHYHRPSERFAFSAGAFYNARDGYFDNTNLQLTKADKRSEAGGRMRFVFDPTSRLRLDLTADYQYSDEKGFPYGLYDTESGTVEEPSTTFLHTYRRHLLNTGLNIGYTTPTLTVSSTTSWQYLNDKLHMDIDYMPADYMSMHEQQLGNALTQELSVKSNASQRWKWTTGVFGSYQWLKTKAPVEFGQTTRDFLATTIRSQMINAMTARGMTEEIINRRGGITLSLDEMATPETFRTPQLNAAIYHESNLQLSDALKLTAGLRLDFNRTKIDYDSKAYMTMTANVMGTEATNTLTSHIIDNTAKNYTELLPKLGLTYNIDRRGSNVYALVSKGFRAGGYNIQMFSDILQTELIANRSMASQGNYDVPHTEADYENIRETITYKPEESWNYEIGTHLNLFGGQMHADATLFYMQIRNQQLSVMAGNLGYGRMMVNAGKSSSCGAELSLRGSALANRLNWSATYSYTRATFREYTDSIDGQLVDYKDNQVPFVPKHTMSATLDYKLLSNATGWLRGITLGANVKGMGKIYWDEANSYGQKFYALLGAHADFDVSGVATVRLWGSNLTNTRYNVFAMNSSATRQLHYFAQRGNPLETGISVDLKF